MNTPTLDQHVAAQEAYILAQKLNEILATVAERRCTFCGGSHKRSECPWIRGSQTNLVP
jgi:hypothetical protein